MGGEGVVGQGLPGGKVQNRRHLLPLDPLPCDSLPIEAQLLQPPTRRRGVNGDDERQPRVGGNCAGGPIACRPIGQPNPSPPLSGRGRQRVCGQGLQWGSGRMH